MSEDQIRLPQCSYEELVKIIKAYGRLPQPSNLEEASKLNGLHRTAISRNTGFLTGIGVLEGGAKKAATTEGKALARALEHEQGLPEAVKEAWEKITLKSDFLQKILTAITIRNGMDESTLEAHITYTAGQPKTKRNTTGARTIVDILKVGGLILVKDGKIACSNHTEPSAEDQKMSQQNTEFPKPLPVTNLGGTNPMEQNVKSPSLHIDIQVHISPEATSEQIDKVFESMARHLYGGPKA